MEGKRLEGCTANINSGVDKAFEGSSLSQLLDAPPSALQGLAPWCVAAAVRAAAAAAAAGAAAAAASGLQ